MQPDLQQKSKQQTAQEPSSTWKMIGDLSTSALEGIKYVAAPGFNAATSLFGSATRACYWLSQQSWSGLFGGNEPDLGNSQTATQLKDTWDKLRDQAPHLDRIGARLGEITERLEKTPKGSEESKKLEEEQRELVLHLSKHLSQNAPQVLELKKLHEEMLRQYLANNPNNGLTLEEIEKQVLPLMESRKRLDTVFRQTSEAIDQLKSYIETHQEKIGNAMCESHEFYHGFAKKRGLSEDSNVEDAFHSHRNHSCRRAETILRQLSDAQRMLDAGHVDDGYIQLRTVQDAVKSHVAETKQEIEHYTRTRNDSLVSAGVSKEELSVFSGFDKKVFSILNDFAEKVEYCLSFVKSLFEEMYNEIEELTRQNMQLLRMKSAAYNGSAGSSILTLGMFEGPYAMTALSFIGEQERLEKLAKKFEFLAPPTATAEEKEEFRRMS